MATLTGNKIKDSYLGLLKSIDNAPFSPRAAGTFVQISDGGGNSLPLYLAVNAIKFYDAYTFPSADGTVDGQVLSTDSNGTLSWQTVSTDTPTLQEVLTQGNTTDLEITTSAQFNGDINGALLQKVKAAEALSKGDVVYISGGTGDNPEVSKAKADSSTTMPAIGIMKEPLSLNAEGECITSGELTGVDLTGIATGAELFVSSATAGELVTTAPTGVANLIQKIGKVIKGGNGGALTVLGAFRTNAMPNLPTGILLGDTTNVATAITDGSSGQILSTDGNGTYSFIDDNAITSAVSPLNLSANQISLGTVPVTKGGTGATTLTGILLGNATSAISGITSVVDGHVLTADGNGGYAFEVSSGDVSISGTPTANQVAIWTDGSTIKGMSALEISTDGTITLSQPNSDDPIVVTNSYNIGGGNIANVTGYNNTGFGHRSLFNVTTGSNNVGLGSLSMQNLTTASSNTAIGNSSMSNDTITGSNNVAIGDQSLLNLQSGANNVAIGVATMANNDMTGTANVAIGYQSLKDVTSGGSNVAIGYQSLKTNQNQSNNVAIGSSSMLNNTGNKNIAIGTNTLYASGFNISNVAIGHESLKDVTTGSRNTAIGYHSGTDNTTGLDNTFIGYQSGYQMTSGNNNVIIGSFGGSTINGSSNNIIISDGGGNNRIQVDSGGSVGIGNSPSNAWADSRAIELGANAILWTEQASGQYNSLSMGLNFYVNSAGSTLYKSANVTATRYQQYQGSHVFQTAGTGTPNTAATFVDQLTISSGGDATFNGDITLLNETTTTSQATLAIKGKQTTSANNAVGEIIFFNNNDSFATIAGARDGANDKGALLFQTQNGTAGFGTRLTISSGGIVGIGSTGIFAGSAAILNLQGSGIALKNDKNGSNNNWSYIQNTGTNNNSDINFYTGNNSSALNLSHSGLATFSNGIKFGTGDTLDAYEEGSWNPIFENATATYTQQDGHYTKIGNKVYFILRLITSAITQSASRVSITLPITSATNYSPVTCFAEKGFNPSGGAGNIVPLVIQNQAYMDFWVIASSTGFNYTDLTYNDLSDDMIIRVSGFYEV